MELNEKGGAGRGIGYLKRVLGENGGRFQAGCGDGGYLKKGNG